MRELCWTGLLNDYSNSVNCFVNGVEHFIFFLYVFISLFRFQSRCHFSVSFFLPLFHLCYVLHALFSSIILLFPLFIYNLRLFLICDFLVSVFVLIYFFGYLSNCKFNELFDTTRMWPERRFLATSKPQFISIRPYATDCEKILFSPSGLLWRAPVGYWFFFFFLFRWWRRRRRRQMPAIPRRSYRVLHLFIAKPACGFSFAGSHLGI